LLAYFSATAFIIQRNRFFRSADFQTETHTAVLYLFAHPTFSTKAAVLVLGKRQFPKNKNNMKTIYSFLKPNQNMKKGLVLLALALTVKSTQAQIVYKDIQPDGLPANGGFDFNGDGTNEFDINTNQYSGDYFTYTNSPTGTNIWAAGNANSGWDVVKPLALNTNINSSGNFIGMGDASMTDWSNGNTTFPLNTDSYIGVKIIINNQTHYGWIRVNWNGNSFVYKDFAYQATPNTAIKAGEKQNTPPPTNVNDVNTNEKIAVYPTPAKNEIFLQMNSTEKATSAVIVDLSGKPIKTVTLNQQAQQTIPVSDLSKGVYFIKIYNHQHAIAMKKIMIQ
jgi:hypothetical protein